MYVPSISRIWTYSKLILAGISESPFVSLKGEGEGGIWVREGERKRKESSPPPSFLGRGLAP